MRSDLYGRFQHVKSDVNELGKWFEKMKEQIEAIGKPRDLASAKEILKELVERKAKIERHADEFTRIASQAKQLFLSQTSLFHQAVNQLLENLTRVLLPEFHILLVYLRILITLGVNSCNNI